MRRRNYLKVVRRLAFGLALVPALVLLASPAAGDDYTRKHAVDQRIESLQARLAQSRAREQSLTAQIADVTGRIRTLEAQVGDVSTRLVVLEHDLALHQERLARLTELFELQTQRYEFLKVQYHQSVDRLSRRLIQLYESDEVTTVEIALAAASFSDMLDQLDYVKTIGRQDSQITSAVARAKGEVRVARERTRRTRKGVAAETRVIAYRTSQVRSVRDQLLASQHALSNARSRKRQNLAAVRESEREELGEIEALSRVSAQLTARIQAAQASGSSSPVDASVSSHGLIWPVNGPVTSPFGMRWGRMHEGIDIGAPYGTPIHAAAGGRVIYAGWMSGYGNLTVIDHGGGLATAYAHQSSIAAGYGASVSQGQVIGYVGCTGHCFGPHLHFEVRVNGTPVDPLGYL